MTLLQIQERQLPARTLFLASLSAPASTRARRQSVRPLAAAIIIAVRTGLCATHTQITRGNSKNSSQVEQFINKHIINGGKHLTNRNTVVSATCNPALAECNFSHVLLMSRFSIIRILFIRSRILSIIIHF
jgi:hypothetical protein